MSANEQDATPTQPEPADGGPNTEPAKPVTVAAATPFKRMPRVPKRRRGWDAFSVPLPLQFAIAVIIGILVATAIAAVYVRWSARSAAEANARATAAEIERISRENQQQIEAAQQAAAQRQRAAEDEERARAEKIREQQRLTEQAQRASVSDAERKERAWAGYYRKPPGCADSASLECANHYIRARRAFEAQYAREAAKEGVKSSP